MNKSKFNKLLKIAINAAIEGGQEIIKVYKTDFNVKIKEDNSPLTLADKNCNIIIENYLKNTEMPILSEEGSKINYSERKKWKYYWLVDPLDGTKEFVKRNGEFTVNIALIDEDSPILGVVYAPVTKALYFSSKDIGSYKAICHNKIENLEKFISNSAQLPLNKKKLYYTIVGSRSHMSLETERFIAEKRKQYGKIDILSIGSSLKICMVAEGKADAYPRYAPTMEWDTAAGHAIARFAGFTIKQYNTSQEIKYNKEKLLNPWFLVE